MAAKFVTVGGQFSWQGLELLVSQKKFSLNINIRIFYKFFLILNPQKCNLIIFYLNQIKNIKSSKSQIILQVFEISQDLMKLDIN